MYVSTKQSERINAVGDQKHTKTELKLDGNLYGQKNEQKQW